MVSLKFGKVLSVWKALRSGLPDCAGAALLPSWLCGGSTEAVGGVLSAAAWPVGCSVGWVYTKSGRQPGFKSPCPLGRQGMVYFLSSL